MCRQNLQCGVCKKNLLISLLAPSVSYTSPKPGYYLYLFSLPPSIPSIRKLLVLPSDYTQNLTTSHCFHCYPVQVTTISHMDTNVRACVLGCFIHVWLFPIPLTATGQAPLSMGFSRQEYWSGLPCPSSGDFPDLGAESASPVFLALQVNSLPLNHGEDVDTDTLS